MRKNNDLVTLILVSYHSNETLKKFLKQISNKYKIIITENALDKTLKCYIKDNYKNIKVLIPDKNLGNGGGINFALENVKTKYALYFDLDIELNELSINKLIDKAESISGWGIMAPNLINYNYNSNHFISNDLTKNISKMKFVEGCALLFNLNKLKKIGFFDTKIFLYYEENDLFLRCLKNNLDILLCKDIFIKHIGNSSTDKIHELEIELNRNWHYMWSKFYYYKKNYSYLEGLKKTASQFIKAILKLFFFYLINKKKSLIYKNRVLGLINSYLNKPSWRRPKIK